MDSKKEIQHVYLVGAKSLGAYGGYETFVYKLTEYHQNKENIKYHVACKANGDGCMDESKFEGVTKINDHEFEFHNAHCFKIDVPQIGSAQAIYYDVAALKACCEHIKKNHIPHPIVYIMACRIGPFAGHFYREIHKLGGTVFLNPDGHEWMRAKWSAPIRKYWKISEQMMVKYCDLAICDSVNIEKYIHECYDGKGIKGSSPKTTFIAYGADLTLSNVINNNPNGLNINNNAGSTHIEGLQKFVVEKGLDVGFAYDGDADRCLCVDEKGNVITGDHILYIYGCYMKERGKLLNNTVVTTVMSNFGLYKAFDEQGIGYAKTAVGDKYVYEYMAKNGCRIGGEQSGHIIFSKYASTGDGILTSLKMMEVMLAKKKPMSELAAALKIYPQVLENVRVTDKKAAQNDEAVQTAVKKVAEGLGDTGRILVRESGTEPVVRVMVEAPDHDTCQKYVSEVVDVIRDRGYSL